MDITIDDNSGFCFGVTNAVEKAINDLTGKESLYCLGELVHNEEEMKNLKKSGLITISHDNLSNIKNSTILFRAHGEPESTYRMAEDNNNTIIDATCPIVKVLQQKVIKSYKNGEHIFIYGKKTHPEVIGIIGNINNDAIVFSSLEELKDIKLPNSITLYSQTTMQLDKYREIKSYIEKKGVRVKAVNSICSSVDKRLVALKEFCKKHDVILFVSGKNSSNGKSLYATCKSINPKSYHISSEKDINIEWFDDCKSLGISGATSTSLGLLNRIKNYIHSCVNKETKLYK